MDPVTIAGLAGAAGSLFSSAASVSSAREQMRFQERMSSTAHQREAADLEKAGLNRMLTMGHPGASTPGGAGFTVGNPAEAMNSARQSAQALANARTERAESLQRIHTGAAQKLLLDEQRENAIADREYTRTLTNVNQWEARQRELDYRLSSTGPARFADQLRRFMNPVAGPNLQPWSLWSSGRDARPGSRFARPTRR